MIELICLALVIHFPYILLIIGLDLHVFCLLLGRTADRIGICVVSCLLMVESISYLRWWVKNLVRKKQGDGYIEDRFLPQELGVLSRSEFCFSGPSLVWWALY